MAMLRATRFRVQNFRNIDDSGWIPIETVTALVGRNESGKTALLKALHKFNPATPNPYSPQREFPRDRYTRDFKDAADWRVCSVEFEATAQFEPELRTIVPRGPLPKVIFSRYYDGKLKYELVPWPVEDTVPTKDVIAALDHLSGEAMKIAAPAPDQEQATQAIRTDLLNWLQGWKGKLGQFASFRDAKGLEALKALRQESNGKANPTTAAVLPTFNAALDELIKRCEAPEIRRRCRIRWRLQRSD